MNKNKKNLKSFIFTIFVMAFITACATTVQEETEAGVLQGVFTIEQAQNGRSIFTSICRTCHVPRDFRAILKQSDDTEALLNDYYDLISTTMPQDSPGGLSSEDYIEIMAYLLSINGFSYTDSSN